MPDVHTPVDLVASGLSPLAVASMYMTQTSLSVGHSAGFHVNRNVWLVVSSWIDRVSVLPVVFGGQRAPTDQVKS